MAGSAIRPVTTDTGDAQRCWRCGRRVEGALEGIRLTVGCSTCCRKFTTDTKGLYPGQHRVTRKRAVNWSAGSTERVRPKVRCVSFGEAGGPAGVSPLRLFLGAEVDIYIKATRTALTNADKRAMLTRFLRRDVRQFNPLLCAVAARGFVPDDYEDVPAAPRTTTQQRFSVLKRVEAIHAECPIAHPEALIRFCLDNPNAGVVEFVELKAKMERVFQVEGDRIMAFLNSRERRNLVDTPFADVAARYEQCGKKLRILRYLRRWCDDDVGEEIIEHPACQLRIQRCETEMKTAQELFMFWETKDDPELREEKLRGALRRLGIWKGRTSVCPFCRHYIQAQVDCEPEEVVGAIRMCRAFDEVWNRFIGERILIALTKFEEWHIREEKGVFYAVSRGKMDALKVLPAVLEDRDSWDYKELTKGYWAQLFLRARPLLNRLA